MDLPSSFKFLDDGLNHRLIGLVKKSGLKHVVGPEGVIRYSPGDAEEMENKLIFSVRRRAFPSWQVQTCPPDWVGRYKEYMTRRDIPFTEELADDQIWFLLPRKYRPHAWKLDR